MSRLNYHKQNQLDAMKRGIESGDAIINQGEHPYKYEQMNQVTTAKVKEVISTKPWNDVIYHNLVMDNGDKINIGKKKTLVPGDELTYQQTGDGQQEYNKAKSVQKDQFSPSPQGGGNDRTDAILYQTCLKAASEALVCMYDPQFANSQITVTAINDMALEMAQQAKANIAKL